MSVDDQAARCGQVAFVAGNPQSHRRRIATIDQKRNEPAVVQPERRRNLPRDARCDDQANSEFTIHTRRVPQVHRKIAALGEVVRPEHGRELAGPRAAHSR